MVVSATLQVYKDSLHNLLPTPEKSHYLFNLRDFSRVIQGLLLSRPESTNTPLSLKRMWLHELFRVYYDRLVDDQDRAWFFENCKQILSEKLEVEMNELCAKLAANPPEVCPLGNCLINDATTPWNSRLVW